MPAKLSQEEIGKRFKEKGIIIIGEYINNHTKVLSKCHCGSTFMALPSNILSGKVIGCGCNNRPLTQEEAKKKFEEKGFELLGEYTNNRTPVLVKCHCGKTFGVRLDAITGSTKSCGCLAAEIVDRAAKKAERLLMEKGFRLTDGYKGRGVYVPIRCHCGKIFMAQPCRIISGKTKSCGCLWHEATRKRLGDMGFVIIGEYISCIAPLLLRCHCGKTFMASINNISRGNTKSCGCVGTSLGEHAIKKILEKYNCEYTKEWTREGRRNVRYLRYDFYLPRHNAIIEFNGEQHFKPSRWNDAAEAEIALAKLQARDKEKRDWAAANGIPLLDINYDEIDQVEDKVWNFLMELRQRKASMVA